MCSSLFDCFVLPVDRSATDNSLYVSISRTAFFTIQTILIYELIRIYKSIRIREEDIPSLDKHQERNRKNCGFEITKRTPTLRTFISDKNVRSTPPLFLRKNIGEEEYQG